jgi:glycosyltransferase involved in cell wall biosynthesis
MRILYVAEAFGGGVFELVKWSAEGVAGAGHDVAIAFGRRPETPTDPAEEIDPRVELLDMPWIDRSPRAQAAGARELRRIVGDWRPDVVHIYSAFAGVIGGAFLPRGVPTVFTPQAFAFTMRDSSAPARATYRALEAFASRRASIVGACSEDEARLARRISPKARVAVVHNGIPELDQPDLPDCSRLGERRVIALGRTVPQRQPEACARILSQVGENASVAWIGGAGGSRGVAGAQALTAAGIEPSGWRDRSAVLAELGRATAYLHWTAWDGLPLSVLEAMAQDAVVIASDIGPNRELVGEHQVCRSEAEAVELLRKVVSDDQLAASMLAEQRRRRGRYSAAGMVSGWLDLYADLLAGESSGGQLP